MTQIYNQPNHPNYGAHRRMWVIINQLVDNFEAFEEEVQKEFEAPWSEVYEIQLNHKKEEKAAARAFLEAMLIHQFLNQFSDDSP